MIIKLPNRFDMVVPEKYLVLVNKEYPVSADYMDNIELVSVKDHNGDPFLMERLTAKAFLELKAYLEVKGIYVDVCSAFRSIEKQRTLFNEAAADKGIKYAERYIAMPAHSEHHTGLAVDLSVFDGAEWIDDESPSYEGTVLESISGYLHMFGFILRYPMGKEGKTKIAYEPWHIRYVGRDAAAVIYNNGYTYCMEDFVER